MTTDSPRSIAYAHARRAAQSWVDLYRTTAKPYPAVCTQCHASHWQGRWSWDVAPDLAPVICPACLRTRDGIAAHVIELSGALPPWWPEVRNLIGTVERAEMRDRPMERVMEVAVGDDKVLVSTTGLHIARRLVAAIVRRFRRQVSLRFGEQSTSIEWLAPRQ